MTKDKSSEIHLGESIIKSCYCKKLLGIKIDSKRNFWWSCPKTNRKLHALVPVWSYNTVNYNSMVPATL